MSKESDLLVIMRALADPVRLRVVETLSAGPLRAGELAAKLAVPAPAMSKHLRVLLDAGVVGDERRREDARVRVFRLRGESVLAVRAWLDQLQAHWDEQLAAFKTQVESSVRQ
ncbi:MAG TPA: metalloregulator ArsR/SmtB family transcription factor [Streptosporangiaceae bacterium]|nr:metalloregulator ArsR/SmtB family transcription factor [Streptosporangiaceae bacterium]